MPPPRRRRVPSVSKGGSPSSGSKLSSVNVTMSPGNGSRESDVGVDAAPAARGGGALPVCAVSVGRGHVRLARGVDVGEAPPDDRIAAAPE